ncbi:MAG: hypothetical protein ACLR07_05905 [Christensenellales bacterium]
MRETALVTGYGRIGQEMTARLCAMGMFVMVCARSKTRCTWRMRRARIPCRWRRLKKHADRRM